MHTSSRDIYFFLPHHIRSHYITAPRLLGMFPRPKGRPLGRTKICPKYTPIVHLTEVRFFLPNSGPPSMRTCKACSGRRIAQRAPPPHQAIRRCHPNARNHAVRAEVRLTTDSPSGSQSIPPRRFALGASNVYLVGENPIYYLPGIVGCESRWSYD